MADFPFIIGPRQVHGARSAEEYLFLQAQSLGLRVQQGRIPDSVKPHAVTPAPEPYIAHRGWTLICGCNGGVSVSVAWDLACCFECGAIYSSLEFPADREAIEAALLTRPGQFRFWNAPDTRDKAGLLIVGRETASTIRAENREHGWKVLA